MEKMCKATCWFCVNDKALKKEGFSEEEVARRRLYQDVNLGNIQAKLGRDKSETYHNTAQIIAMDAYSKTTLVDPDSRTVTTETRKNCVNGLDECAYYASKGMCFTKSTFMMNNCPLACMMCEAFEQFNKCVGKRHPFSIPMVIDHDYLDYIEDMEGMELNSIVSLFEKLKRGGAAEKITKKVKVVTQPPPQEDKDEDGIKREASQKIVDPYIVQIEDFLSPEECDELISLAKEDGFTGSKVNLLDHFDGTHKFQMPLRNSESVKCSTETEGDEAMKCSDATTSIMEKIASFMGTSTNYFEPAELIHYPPGGYYTLHNDYVANDEWKPAGPRILSMYITLDEAVTGGSIGFPELDWLIVKPRKGSLLLWTNVQNGLSYDRSVKNEILPVEEGSLYMMQTHVHLHDYVYAQDMGCVSH